MEYLSALYYVIAFLAAIVAAVFAYEQGYLDPLIEKAGCVVSVVDGCLFCTY